MHVHLVTIEISVVRSCDGQVESECRKRKHLDSMTHDGHLMQRWLPVEQDIVSILQVSLDLVADFKMHITSVSQKRQINLAFVVPNNVLRARPLSGTVLD